MYQVREVASLASLRASADNCARPYASRPRTMRGRGHALVHGGGYTRDLDGYTSGLALPGPTGASGRVPPLEVAAHRGQWKRAGAAGTHSTILMFS